MWQSEHQLQAAVADGEGGDGDEGGQEGMIFMMRRVPCFGNQCQNLCDYLFAIMSFLNFLGCHDRPTSAPSSNFIKKLCIYPYYLQNRIDSGFS